MDFCRRARVCVPFFHWRKFRRAESRVVVFDDFRHSVFRYSATRYMVMPLRSFG
jgi:hypothetical protein